MCCSTGLLLKCGSSCFQTNRGKVQSIKHAILASTAVIKNIQSRFSFCSGGDLGPNAVKILPRSSYCPQKMPINRPLTYDKIPLLLDKIINNVPQGVFYQKTRTCSVFMVEIILKSLFVCQKLCRRTEDLPTPSPKTRWLFPQLNPPSWGLAACWGPYLITTDHQRLTLQSHSPTAASTKAPSYFLPGKRRECDRELGKASQCHVPE